MGRTRVRSHYRRTKKGMSAFEVTVLLIALVLLLALMTR